MFSLFRRRGEDNVPSYEPKPLPRAERRRFPVLLRQIRQNHDETTVPAAEPRAALAPRKGSFGFLSWKVASYLESRRETAIRSLPRPPEDWTLALSSRLTLSSFACFAFGVAD